MTKKFLIGQLGRYGDCLYATTLAKQIKLDYPDSQVTWAISKKYSDILLNNPHVDYVWEIDVKNDENYEEGWLKFSVEAKKKQQVGEFDTVILSQIPPYFENFDGTIRSSILAAYKKTITVDVSPVIRLSDLEVSNVFTFATTNRLSLFKQVILFEYAPGSNQSFVNLELALQVAKEIVESHNDTCVVLSGPAKLPIKDLRLIDASELTYRENAELTKYCTLLIGCSSGITWLSTSDWAKKLNMVQLFNKRMPFFIGVKFDFDCWNIPTDGVIEMDTNNAGQIIACISKILRSDFSFAKNEFDKSFQPDYSSFRFGLKYLFAFNKRKVFSIVSKFSIRNKHLNKLKLYQVLFSELNIYLTTGFKRRLGFVKI